MFKDYTVAKALVDVSFMYDQLISSHPGTINPEDSNFENSLKDKVTAVQQALAVATDSISRINLIRDFARSFQDSHLGVELDSKVALSSYDCKKPRRDFLLETKESGLVWLCIPSFCPDNCDKERLESFIAQLKEHRFNTIVFDLRDNRGGNSFFGNKILQSLCGLSYADFCQKSLNKNVRCLWKVSESNLEHVNKFPEIMRHQFQEGSEAVLWADKVCQNMQKAFDANRLFFEFQEAVEEISQPEVENLFKGKVYAIVDKRCFSACLDFLDLLKISKIPLVIIGQTTGADSSYMEVREVKLPSEIGLFRFPIKVYINRIRGHNEPYKPDIDCSEFIEDTKMLESVILAHKRSKEIDTEK